MRLASPDLRLFGLLRSFAFADSDASPAAIFINEFDTSSLERLFQNRKSCSTRFGDIRFDLANCHNAQPRTIGEFLLTPIKKSSGCSALCCGYHRRNMPD
jgi:hypothetical protein